MKNSNVGYKTCNATNLLIKLWNTLRIIIKLYKFVYLLKRKNKKIIKSHKQNRNKNEKTSFGNKFDTSYIVCVCVSFCFVFYLCVFVL